MSPAILQVLGTCTLCSALRPVAASCGLGQFGYNNSPWWYCKPWNNRIGKGCAPSARNVSCIIIGTRALGHNACSALRPVSASCGLGQFGYTNSPWWYCKPWNRKMGKGCASSAQNVSCNNTGTRARVHTAAHCGLLRPRAALANLLITRVVTLLGGIASLGTIKLGRIVSQVPEMSPAILQLPGHLYTLQRIAACCGLVR